MPVLIRPSQESGTERPWITSYAMQQAEAQIIPPEPENGDGTRGRSKLFIARVTNCDRHTFPGVGDVSGVERYIFFFFFFFLFTLTQLFLSEQKKSKNHEGGGVVESPVLRHLPCPPHFVHILSPFYSQFYKKK